MVNWYLNYTGKNTAALMEDDFYWQIEKLEMCQEWMLFL